MNFSNHILKRFLEIKKAKKHNWIAHRNHPDLKKFWGQHFGKPKHLDLNWQPWLKYLLSYSQYKWFQGRNEYGQSWPNDTMCVSSVKEYTVHWITSHFPLQTHHPKTGEVDFILTIFSKHISLVSKIVLTQ